MTADRTYWLGTKAWHADDGQPAAYYRGVAGHSALCGRSTVVPAYLTADRVPVDGHLCGSCRNAIEGSPTRKTEAQFWLGVEKTSGCWLWRGRAHRSKRYGTLWWHGRKVMPHRLSYELAYGVIPVGLEVLHACDNGFCVRPEHLSLGTHLDNMRDAVAKGRSARGEGSGTSKLTASQVVEMRQRRVAGEPTTSLARAFGVHAGTVSRVTRGEQRLHEPGPRVGTMSYYERGRLSHGSRGPLEMVR